mgnify:CR=1 FL=1
MSAGPIMILAGGTGGLGDRARAEILHCIESVAAAFEENADAVDDMIGAHHCPVHRIPVTQIGLDRHDLADTAKRLQVESEVGPPDRNPDPVTAAGEGAHHMASNKAGSAKDRNEFWFVQRWHRYTPWQDRWRRWHRCGQPESGAVPSSS